jgi:2-polyprenyl-3-methyl-5-hydroxy-6-metoxy-1,4-benzoquinol methylase
MRDFYDKLYDAQKAYHWDYIKRKDSYYIQHTRIILNLVSKFAVGRILDVGCGDAYISSRISETFEDVIGIDISEKAVKIAGEKSQGVRFAVASCTDLPFSGGSFDTIVASEIIEHVSYNDGKSFLKEATRVLTPGGRIIISTPNLSNLYRKYLGVFYRNPEHLREYGKKEFAELLSAHFGILQVNSGVSLPVVLPLVGALPVIGRLVKIPKCQNYIVGEKMPPR